MKSRDTPDEEIGQMRPVVRQATAQIRIARHVDQRPTSRSRLLDDAEAVAPRTAFVDYSRHLTPEGGILFVYKDIDVRWRHTLRRLVVWSVLAAAEYHVIADQHPTTGGWLVLILLCIADWLLVRKPVQVMRSLEIRPDGMIVDGSDVFWLEQIGDNWPAFALKNDDPDSLVLAGVYGTRNIEYATSHRLDSSDRTPEVLAMHLKEAMEQLWGRTELVFDRSD